MAISFPPISPIRVAQHVIVVPTYRYNFNSYPCKLLIRFMV